MGNQPLRGNPEGKMVFLTTGLTGGMDVTHSDDVLPPQIMRNIVNYDIGLVGELTTRKGFGKNNALSELLFPENEYINTPNEEFEECFFYLITNDNYAWKRLADSTSVDDYITLYGETNSIRYLRLYINATKDLVWEDITIEIKAVPVVTIEGGVIDSADFVGTSDLFNIRYVDKYGRIYITNNDKGMLIFDTESSTPTDPWTYIGLFTEKTNQAYKPNGIEVRKIGFNVLGGDGETGPMYWFYDYSEYSTETIQGVFLTTSDLKPLKVVPGGLAFNINIIYTGDLYDFNIVLSEAGEILQSTITKDTLLSVDGSLGVFSVVLSTQPSSEVEIAIDFVSTDPNAILPTTYYDYYMTGPVPSDTEAVSTLNPGDYGIMEMYDRLVYYKGNALWFSEIDVYDYIPNYNYVVLPLDSSDEIVRIVFFRTSYIIFTKRRIYRLTGDFGSSSMNLEIVSDAVGCIAPNTAMVVNNELVFVSTLGLRSLKTEYFKNNLENIRQFDESISPLIVGNELMCAVLYNDMYIIYANYNEGTRPESYTSGMREFPVADEIVYYYKQGAFTTNIYAKDELGAYVSPNFIFMEAGQMYSMKTDGVYRYGDSYDDFGYDYTAIVETGGFNFGYQTHEKKVKHIIVKASGGTYEQPITLQVAADGEVVVSSELTPIGTDGDGNIIYEEEALSINSTISGSEPIGSIFGEGVMRYHTKKFRAPSRGKNIAIRILSTTGDKISIHGIGFIYKLGKVKE